MIPEKTTMKSCVGKLATLDQTIINGGGHGITQGSIVKIVGANSKGMIIRTTKCLHCGQFTEISHIKRCNLTLIEGKDHE